MVELFGADTSELDRTILNCSTCWRMLSVLSAARAWYQCRSRGRGCTGGWLSSALVLEGTPGLSV